MRGFTLLIAGLCLFASSTASAQAAQDDDTGKRRFPRVRLGGIMVNAGYTHWSGAGGPWGWGPGYWGGPMMWGPAMWGPMWGPGWWGGPMMFSPWMYSGFGWAANRGEVKLNTAGKNAEVYIDGGYAGVAGQLKSMWLDPGVYNIEVKDGGATAFAKKVYVLSGKTLRLEVR